MKTRELLESLIACESVTPNGGGSLEIIERLLADAGFEVMRLPRGRVDNLFARRCGGEVRLLFAGHTDVVPPGDLAQWHTPPFVPSEKDGYLYGRGAADMKSGVAAMVVAALRAAAKNAADGIGLFFTTDEEGPAIDGTRYFVEWWQQQGLPRIPYCIVGEPSCERVFGDSIKIGRRGSLTGRVRFSGQQTHVAYPYLGDNPAHRLVAALNEIWQQWHGNEAKVAAGEMVTTYQLVALEAGVGADNVTPPLCDAVFNFRYTAADGEADIKHAVANIFSRHALSGQWRCEWENGAEPFAMPADSTLAKTLSDIIRRQTGTTPVCNARGGTTDGRFLKDICGELAEFGVKNETIHAANEKVNLADAETLTDIYEATIKTLATKS